MSQFKNEYDELNGPGYLRIHQVLNYLPIGKSTWWKGIKDGRFPKGAKLGPRTTVWSKRDILHLLKQIDSLNGNDA